MISIETSRCSGCGDCELVCPHHVLELVERHAALAAEDRCIECGACQLNCREGAIAVTKGTGCLVAIAREMWSSKGSQRAGTGSPAQPGCGCG